MLPCMCFLSKVQHEKAAREPAAGRAMQRVMSPVGARHGEVSEVLAMVLGEWRGLWFYFSWW